MPAQPTEAALAACKRQIDIALQITEALVEGAEKVREIQLAAAVDAHAALDATRKSLESAATLPQLVELQSRLATENLGKMFNYWTSLAGNAREVQARIGEILGAAPGMPMEGLPSFTFPGVKLPEKAA